MCWWFYRYMKQMLTRIYCGVCLYGVYFHIGFLLFKAFYEYRLSDCNLDRVAVCKFQFLTVDEWVYLLGILTNISGVARIFNWWVPKRFEKQQQKLWFLEKLHCFYSSLKLDGFQNPLFKFYGCNRTHKTDDIGATVFKRVVRTLRYIL